MLPEVPLRATKSRTVTRVVVEETLKKEGINTIINRRINWKLKKKKEKEKRRGGFEVMGNVNGIRIRLWVRSNGEY